MISLTLPWPDRILHPNSRPHWSQKAKAVKSARHYARVTTMSARGPIKPLWQRVSVSYTFHPPDKRRRDVDGMISSTKAWSDGIADALAIDDSNFDLSFSVGEPVKGGLVKVTIKERK